MQVGRDVVEGERRLAEQERLIVQLKREGQDAAKAEEELEILRDTQRGRNRGRQRFLSLTQH